MKRSKRDKELTDTIPQFISHAEHNTIFSNKTAGRACVKPGSGRQLSVFPALPKSQNGSMRQIPELPTTPHFLRKETAGRGVDVSLRGRQVNNLPHTFGFDWS